MKAKRGIAVSRFIPLATMLGSLVMVCVLGYIVFHQSNLLEAYSSLPPEIQSAAVAEAALQSLPEQNAAPKAIRVPIFIYHSVRPYIPGESKIQDKYDITTEMFEDQLKYLQDNGYTVITLDDLIVDMQNGTTSPVAKPVVLTFDDGWHNQYQYAFPLLQKYGMTATFYIYTNSIGHKYFLTWDEVKEMDAAGMTIASHTVSHPRMEKLPIARVQKELVDSKQIIEAELGKPIVHFASPGGYINAAIMAAAKEAGYVTARTTYKGDFQNNPFRLAGFLATDDFKVFVAELR